MTEAQQAWLFLASGAAQGAMANPHMTTKPPAFIGAVVAAVADEVIKQYGARFEPRAAGSKRNKRSKVHEQTR